MTDLFSSTPTPPLAELLRPTSLAEVAGQSHLLGPGKPLRLAFDAGKLHSFILWGPPGVGKTTLARLAAKAVDCEFISLSAVLAGVKEIRLAIDAAQHILDHKGRSTILFVDEIHRFNKAQQDALLPFVESGLLKVIGATTENPSFEVNSALLSRAQVYQLKPLDETELLELYSRAKTKVFGPLIEQKGLTLLAGYSDGDARRYLNLLEQVWAAAPRGLPTLSLEFVKSATSPSLRRFDKEGSEFYDQISAFQKSIRGSSTDGALYLSAPKGLVSSGRG